MAAIFTVGNDGAVSLPTGVDFNVKVWAANITYVSSDTTGFSHAAKTRRLGVLDVTGSLAGTPTVGNGGTPFGTIPSSPNNVITTKQLGGSLTLSNYNGTATQSAANLVMDVLFSSVALNTDKNGDATITVNYELNDSTGPTVVWSTSLP